MSAAREDDQYDYIINYCNEFWPDFTISKHQLDNPNSDFVVSLYERFQRTLMQTIIDTAQDDDAEAENKADIDSIFSLVGYLNRLFTSYQPDLRLTLTDVYEPTAKRTKLKLYFLCHYLSYVKSSTQDIRDIVIQHKTKAAEYSSKVKQLDEYKSKIAEQAEEMARKKDTITKLKNDLECGKSRYSTLKLQKNTMQLELQKLKQELKSLLSTYESQSSLKKHMEEHIKQLNQQIVNLDSFNGLQKLKEYLTQTQDDLKKKVECASENLSNRKPTLEHFEKMSKELSNFMLHLEEIKTLQDSNTLKTSQLQQLRHGQAEKEIHIQKQLKEIKEFKENIKTLKTAIDSSKKEHENFKKQAEETMNQLKKNQKEEEELQVLARNRERALQIEISKLTNECDATSTEIKNLNSFYEESYERILKNENKITSTFISAMKDLKDAVSGTNESD